MAMTLQRPVTLSGLGLHGGRPCRARVAPAAPRAGLRLNGVPLAEAPVLDTRRATTLCTPDGPVAMVEHLLGALVGLGITDAEVHVEGGEVPVVDGSAAPWVARIEPVVHGPDVGWAPPHALRVGDETRWIRVSPASSLSLTVVAHHPPAPAWRCAVTQADFATAVAPARTYVFQRDVAALRAAGLARGGSLDNALVLDDQGRPVGGALRLPDEPARHKALDLLGDLATLGFPLRAHVEAHCPGHGLNHALVAALRALA
ncbi:MAG: UDP-3-O-acyl-N-acetylglucosamine deacetylase, partial [Myxococcales bacterium]|nr:UDP-3-O-acyl-N-acetylglucosamine deacetylase [Myxococcales bacterium]